MKKNKLYIFIIFIIVIAIITSISLTFNKNNEEHNKENNTNYIAQKSSLDKKTEEINKVPVEEEISSFSTSIYDKNPSRQNNITLTCQELNDTIVPNGSEFSFCNTVGSATPEKGYQKADVFDQDGNIYKGLGGGKCQISSTLYNSVLQIPSLIITERHPHSRKVVYVDEGKDAAVSYGSYDFKFRNDYGHDIKIKAENNEEEITIKLLKIS